MLSMFKSKLYYRHVLTSIWYICPESSMSLVKNHPFKDHDKVHTELTPELLQSILNQLLQLKKELEEDNEQYYNCLTIDDMAAMLKDKK